MKNHVAIDEMDISASTKKPSDPSRPSKQNCPTPGYEDVYRETWSHMAAMRRLLGSSLEHVERELVKVMAQKGVIS